MTTNTFEHIEKVLLQTGFKKSTIPRYYTKGLSHGFYKSVSVYPSVIKYMLATNKHYFRMIFMSSKYEEFDQTYSEFEQQCEIHLTTTLFSYDRF
jgi:hypothetical protein